MALIIIFWVLEADTRKTVYDLVFDRGIIGKRSGAFVSKDDILYFAAERWKKVFIGSPQLTGMYLYALNIKTGKYRWHIYMKNVLFLNLSLDNNTLLATTQNKVLSLDTKSGSAIWEVYHVNNQMPITPISNGYFDTSDGYNFSACSVESGKEIWKTKGIIPEGSRIEISNPCVSNGDVYFIAGALHGPHFFYALDAKTGKLMWKKELGKIALNPPLDWYNIRIIWQFLKVWLIFPFMIKVRNLSLLMQRIKKFCGNVTFRMSF